jgi:hypothetical protein
MEIKEIKTLCLIRVPPGDRWREPDGNEVFETLTLGLEHIFQKTGAKSIEEHELAPPKPRTYSIYGDGY